MSDLRHLPRLGASRYLGLLLIAMGVSTADVANAEPLCEPAQTLDACLQIAPVGEQVENLNAFDLSSFGGGSLRPFLETFLAELSGFSTSGEGGDLKLVYNTPRQRFSFEGTFHQPEVAEKVLAAYAEDDRETKETELKKGLDNLSDFEARFLFNYLNGTRKSKSYGRRFEDYQRHFTEISEEILKKRNRDLVVQRAQALSPMLLTIEEVHANKRLGSRTLREVESILGPERFATFEQQLATAKKAMEAAHADSVAAIKDSKVDRFYELIANQPQLYLEVTGRLREEAAGLTTWSAKFVWEKPQGANFNRWQKFCEGPPYRGVDDFTCYRDYLDQTPDLEEDLKHKERWKVVLDATYVKDYEFVDPSTGAILLESDDDLKVTLSAGYSRVLRLTKDSNGKTVDASRFDAELFGEYVDNEEVFSRRACATITLTNRINDQFDAALSFQWASDPEYAVDETNSDYLLSVQKDFSANVGLRFKVGTTRGTGNS